MIGKIYLFYYYNPYDRKEISIYNKKNDNKIITTIPMTNNKSFPLRFGGKGGNLANMDVEKKSWLWHLKYGHLNFASLNLLTSQEMDYGFPKVEEDKTLYEGCALGKHDIYTFPKGKS